MTQLIQCNLLRSFSGLFVLLAAGVARPVLGDEGHVDFEIGLAPGTNDLFIVGDDELFDGSEMIELLPGDGLLTGFFIADEPGFVGVEVDEPGEIDAIDILSPHAISLERVSFDAGFLMFEPPATPILTSDLAHYPFVQENPPIETGFHNDLIFAATGSPGDTFSATFRIVDGSGTYNPSEQFSLGFVVVPEPASVGWLAFTGLMLRRRRGSRRAG